MKHGKHFAPKPKNKATGATFLRKAKADVLKFSGSSQDAVTKPKNNKKFKPQSRKAARKQQRQLKKVHRQEHYARKHGKFVKAPNSADDDEELSDFGDETVVEDEEKPSNRKRPVEESQTDEKEAAKARKKLKDEKETKRQRIRNLRSANKDEDKIIKQMEKNLKLNKRKSKSLPKSFVEDGLDYLLDLCDEETRGRIAKEEMDFGNVEADFEADLAAVVGKPTNSDVKNGSKKTKTKESSKVSQDNDDDFEDEEEDEEIDEMDDEEDMSGEDFDEGDEEDSFDEEEEEEGSFDEEEGENEEEEESASDEEDVETRIKAKIAQNRLLASKTKEEKPPKNTKKADKKVRFELEDEEDEEIEDNEDNEDYKEDKDNEEKPTKDGNELWEDIYGRLRDKSGNVVKVDQPISTATGRYVPPFRRQAEDTDDAQLRRTLKGLLNRLAENNMASIANQIEELYLKYSRQSMHKVMSSLFLDSLVSPVLTPERLIQEHALLLSVLHANVGMEIGAMMLETVVRTFDEQYKAQPSNIASKELDNLLLLLSHLYSFKVVGHMLLYGIMNHILVRFEEKDVDLLVLGFKTVGFGLRKDDPVALKQLIVSVQAKASQMASGDQSRLKFMLDVIMAIRNNHMAKIPGYDYSHVEHLKKLSRGLVRKGTTSTPLQVRYDEILAANSRGRWWVVGSAWEGHGPEAKPAGSNESGGSTPQFSAELLELARKQRMNTEARRGIFCILMTAEDFLEAFERLMRLGLKGNQEREILHVILHCSLHEKEFNPYYAHLASKFCLTDRKYQLNLQFALWDKFREISELKTFQVSNLAKFTAFLLSNQALPLTVLKSIEFSSLDRTLLRFMRQLLLAYLLQATEDSLQTAFTKLKSDKLRLLREGLRLFLHHFLLKNADKMPIEESQKLQQKVQLVDRVMSSDGL